MINFWETAVLPALEARKPSQLLEIGASSGAQTRKVLDWAAANDATLHVIDPRPAFDVEEHERQWGRHFVMHRSRSLDALPQVGPVDLALVDGDHNWYTVFSELRALDAANERWPLVLMHDVGWPYGRRDMYYTPDNVPERYRQPYEISGFLPLTSALTASGRNSNLPNASHEGGPCNGVLTAAEDFLASTARDLLLLARFGPGGLGMLVDRESLRADEALTRALAAIHEPKFAVAISPLHATRELDVDRPSPRRANAVRPAEADGALGVLGHLDTELKLTRRALLDRLHPQAERPAQTK